MRNALAQIGQRAVPTVLGGAAGWGAYRLFGTAGLIGAYPLGLAIGLGWVSLTHRYGIAWPLLLVYKRTAHGPIPVGQFRCLTCRRFSAWRWRQPVCPRCTHLLEAVGNTFNLLVTRAQETEPVFSDDENNPNPHAPGGPTIH